MCSCFGGFYNEMHFVIVSEKLCIDFNVYKVMFYSSCLFRYKRVLASYLTPLWVLFLDIGLSSAWQGKSQASGPQVWIYTMLKSHIFAASYYYPFALIRGRPG